jgi:hypothetical protein
MVIHRTECKFTITSKKEINRMNHIYNQPQFGVSDDWFGYKTVYDMFVKMLPQNGTIVEVGVWKGKSLAYLGVEAVNSGKNLRVFGVDTWLGSPEHQNDPLIKTDTLYNLFMTNIFPLLGAVTPIRMASVNAAKLFPDNSIDIVFIDACHEYECVKEDINAWFPKIKKGGIISGHDYQWGDKRPGGAPVKKAVDEIFGVTNVTFIDGNWENVWMVNVL